MTAYSSAPAKQDIEEDAVNRERLEFAFRELGQRLGCRVNNTRLAENDRVDCLQIRYPCGRHRKIPGIWWP